jgi:hypothetical protein
MQPIARNCNTNQNQPIHLRCHHPQNRMQDHLGDMLHDIASYIEPSRFGPHNRFDHKTILKDALKRRGLDLHIQKALAQDELRLRDGCMKTWIKEVPFETDHSLHRCLRPDAIQLCDLLQGLLEHPLVASAAKDSVAFILACLLSTREVGEAKKELKLKEALHPSLQGRMFNESKILPRLPGDMESLLALLRAVSTGFGRLEPEVARDVASVCMGLRRAGQLDGDPEPARRWTALLCFIHPALQDELVRTKTSMQLGQDMWNEFGKTHWKQEDLDKVGAAGVITCKQCQKVLSPSAMPKCGGCHTVFYCSRRCQRKHWRAVHRSECKRLFDTPMTFDFAP